MALTISASRGISAKPVGLDVWMARVLQRIEQVQRGFDADDVHDLRVAFRRCRTMADALSEVNPGPGWHKLKKLSRKPFRTLGDLRDCQVQQDWLKKLSPPGDPLRKHTMRSLSLQETQLRKNAARSLDEFDRKEWKKLARKLGSKARLFPLESVVFQRLALARLNQAVELYRLARNRRSSVAWHRVRIAIKRFRYVVDNFLPARYEAWAADLKRVQDLLGEVHDLDMLRTTIRRQASHEDPVMVAEWRAKLQKECSTRLSELVATMSGPGSLWLTWRAAFPWGHSLVSASVPQRRTA